MSDSSSLNLPSFKQIKKIIFPFSSYRNILNDMNELSKTRITDYRLFELTKNFDVYSQRKNMAIKIYGGCEIFYAFEKFCRGSGFSFKWMILRILSFSYIYRWIFIYKFG